MSVPTDNRYWEKAVYIYSKPYAESFKEKIEQIKQEKSEYTFQDFSEFDTLHPCGHYGLELLLQEQTITGEQTLLDIGSGLGGPSRFLNESTGAKVYGVDLIEHFVDMSNELAQMCRKTDQLEYYQGDVLDSSVLPENRFEGAYSIAVILVYIQDPMVFHNVYKSLKPGAWFYLEDYFLLKPREEIGEFYENLVFDELRIQGVRTESVIRSQLEDAGFVVEKFDDIGTTWSEYAWERSNRIFTDYRSKGETGDETYLKNVSNYGYGFAKVLNKMQHMTPEQFEARFPASCQYISEWRDLVYNPENRVVSSCRVIARKPVA